MSNTRVDYTGREAADLVGITYRQLDYWARTDLVRPSIADANGSGTRRRYSASDIAELRMVKALLDAGHRLERIRAVVTCVHDQEPDADYPFVVMVADRVLIASDATALINIISGATGVVSVFTVRSFWSAPATADDVTT